jgi:hypothetical protein
MARWRMPIGQAAGWMRAVGMGTLCRRDHSHLGGSLSLCAELTCGRMSRSSPARREQETGTLVARQVHRWAGKFVPLLILLDGIVRGGATKRLASARTADEACPGRLARTGRSTWLLFTALPPPGSSQALLVQAADIPVLCYPSPTQPVAQAVVAPGERHSHRQDRRSSRRGS